MNQASKPSPAVVSALAPSGKLRAAINLGNPILVGTGADGKPKGVSVDLATELAKRLGMLLELVPFNAASKVVEAIGANSVNIGFYAIDPKRGEDTLFTGPYIMIEGGYLVTKDSPIKENAEVDRKNNRVVVGKGSAYNLFLTRELKNAAIVRAPTSPAVTDMFVHGKYEVAAGVKQQLEADAKRILGLRLLDGRFMEIRQAMATPQNRAATHDYLIAYVEEMKKSGFVAAALTRHQIEDAEVAPAGTK
ncbi:MAG: ABC transporter substrate-binding protein [Candidatus Protistobacter heckmanni]|nr:ABC transporter substrate-binding protein [Candidatus Protistobacter heckmanni]